MGKSNQFAPKQRSILDSESNNSLRSRSQKRKIISPGVQNLDKKLDNRQDLGQIVPLDKEIPIPQ